MTNRKSAETTVPITPPTALNASNCVCIAVAASAMARSRQDDDGRMAEREEQADADRALAFLHQLARDVVDGGDMVGVDRMAQPEHVGEQRGAEQSG